MYANFILLLLINQNGEILLLCRINTPFCNGCYCLPGCEIRQGESASKAATRELRESLGVSREITQHDCVRVIHRKCNEAEFFATVFKTQLNNDEIPQIMHTERYDGMLWGTFEHLPEKTVPAHRHALAQIQQNNFYSEYDWRMTTDNDITLQAYENGLNNYIENTPQIVSGEFREWIDNMLSFVAKHNTIFEIGSGPGRDAAYIESKGYQILRSDAAQSFVAYLQQQGHDVLCFNVLNDDFGKLSYDMIFANAVFLHFSRDEFIQVLTKIYTALNNSGFLSFSVKKGVGEEWCWSKGLKRYFCYWMLHELVVTLRNIGFKLVYSQEADSWIRIVAQKTE